MCNRQVCGNARLHTKRHPYQLGFHIVEAGCFGIESNNIGLLDFFKPLIERGLVEDRCIVCFNISRGNFFFTAFFTLTV